VTLLMLVRHARHEGFGRVLSGRGEAGLAEAGVKEAAGLAGRLAAFGRLALYASPRARALQTAGLVATGAAICPALDEIDYGDWTGLSFGQLESDPRWRVWNECRATARPPNGEAMYEVQARALRWIGTLTDRHPDDVVVAVSHADVIKAVLMAHLGLSLHAHDRLEIAPASMSALDLWTGGGRVRFINNGIAP
jgi:broad specificity phosphatase PhoE